MTFMKLNSPFKIQGVYMFEDPVFLYAPILVGDHNVQLVYKFAHLAKIVKICL